MIRVGVLRGGTGNKYSESLATGAYVLKHLPRDKYEVLDIFLDKEGIWHMGGLPMSFEKLALRVDVIWNALHGFYGEDGKLQQLLENLGIKYTGAGPLSSAIAMNKKLTKDHLSKLGVQTPHGIYIEDWGTGDGEEIIGEVVRAVSMKFSPPWNIEPISGGQTSGPIEAKTRSELHTVLMQMRELKMPVLIESVVSGKKVSVVAANDFRGKNIYTFLPSEKGSGKIKMKKTESAALQKIAADVHSGLQLGPYSKVNAVVTPKGHIHVTSVETMPAFHSESDLQQSLDAVGVSFEEFAEHLISEAHGRK